LNRFGNRFLAQAFAAPTLEDEIPRKTSLDVRQHVSRKNLTFITTKSGRGRPRSFGCSS
jgi:hypothetical protein